MPKLNDIQTILLSTASRRDDLAIYPLCGVTAGARADVATECLIKAGFAERRGEGAVFATLAGLTAIGVEVAEIGIVEASDVSSAPRPTKSATVLALLSRDNGTTMSELTAATGWLPHSTRAALTGLRKKGHAIDRFKRDDETCYRIVAAQK